MLGPRVCVFWLLQQCGEYLLIVFDVVLQNDSVGLVGLVPQQGHAVLTGVLLADG